MIDFNVCNRRCCEFYWELNKKPICDLVLSSVFGSFQLYRKLIDYNKNLTIPIDCKYYLDHFEEKILSENTDKK